MGLEKRTSAAKAVKRANVMARLKPCPSSRVSTHLKCVPQGLKRVCENLKGNRRSLHYAPPYFLSTLLALAILMRLSLQKGAYVDVASSA